jgi:hypothetical protein
MSSCDNNVHHCVRCAHEYSKEHWHAWHCQPRVIRYSMFTGDTFSLKRLSIMVPIVHDRACVELQLFYYFGGQDWVLAFVKNCELVYRFRTYIVRFVAKHSHIREDKPPEGWKKSYENRRRIGCSLTELSFQITRRIGSGKEPHHKIYRNWHGRNKGATPLSQKNFA